jgi:hypothetical protein
MSGAVLCVKRHTGCHATQVTCNKMLKCNNIQNIRNHELQWRLTGVLDSVPDDGQSHTPSSELFRSYVMVIYS